MALLRTYLSVSISHQANFFSHKFLSLESYLLAYHAVRLVSFFCHEEFRVRISSLGTMQLIRTKSNTQKPIW